MDGFINLYKPKDFTSHDALNIVRRNFRGTKIGHGGTLDPDATGVLPVCLGKATKLQDMVMGGDKAYEADVLFGVDSLSLDCGSDVVVTDSEFCLDLEKLQTVLAGFVGKQQQYPPAVSAIKQNGVPLYKLARRGETIETKPREIEIYELLLKEVYADEAHPRIRIAVKCSKGTYIRSLGRDIGAAMGTTAIIDRLERSRAGMFSLENAVTLDEIKAMCDQKDYSFILPMDAAVKDLPRFELTTGEEWKAVLDGNVLTAEGMNPGEAAIYDPYGSLMAVGTVSEGKIHPDKILWEARKRQKPMISAALDEKLPFDKTAVVIGNFDGLHLGHRFLIEHCLKDAEREGLASVVLTFSPHPKIYFGDQQHYCLQQESDKKKCIDQLGADALVVAAFKESFAELSETEFVENVLKEHFKAKKVYIGDDFSFGKGRCGTADSLKVLCGEVGIEVMIIPRLLYGDAAVSSSRIKEALAKGDIGTAVHLLGRPYTIHGEVVHGREIGRTLGFPTANLDLEPDLFCPRSGGYIAYARYGGKKHEAVACISGRPTVEEGQRKNLEVHILDDAPDLYGMEMTVTLLGFLRGEQKFDSLDALKAGIAADVERTKNFFAKRRGGSCNSR